MSKKLSDYNPEYASAKVFVPAMLAHLQALDEIANDPAKVKAWSNRVWKELEECQICIV